MEDEPTDTASLTGYVPFESERQQEYLDAGYWRDLTFHEVVDHHVSKTPDRTAVIGPQRELTYAELEANSRHIASYFVGELGLQPNERIVLQTPNCVEFLELFFACSRVGVIPVMVLPRHRRAEAHHVVDLVDARAYVVDDSRYETGFNYVSLAEDVRNEHESLDHCIALTDNGEAAPEGWTSLDEMCVEKWHDQHGDLIASRDVDPSLPGVMLLSGGTTGMPKGIPRTHNDYIFQWEHMAEIAGVEEDWVAFPSVPIGHNASLNCIVGAAFWRGATVAVEPARKPESLMAFIERVEGNYTLPMPTQILDILNHPSYDDYDLTSLNVLVSGGQNVPPNAVYEAVEQWEVGFCTIFGMAEGPLICTRPDDDIDIQAHTVGTPIAPEADEVKIVDTDRENEVPMGEPGELTVRGPGYFTGYFRNETENTENFADGGWFYTEDVLARREDGNLEVYGRIKDTIIRGGENIYAPGIEEEIIEHPKVANVAVIGMPDERLGERPGAFVELVADAETMTLDELSNFLDEQGVAVFKRPERLEILDALPRTEVGKIEKQELLDRITQQLEEEERLSDDY
jgi:2,3-dihydroxybenzoate-AMP ligase